MKTKIQSILLFLLPLFLNQTAIAQFVNFGQDRPSIHWKQINTADFQIIYPDFFEDNAQKVANIYNKLYNHANTLGLRPKKISMILHADGGVSNGNVAWAPKKSELYTMPPQEPSDNWLEHLCIHEFRHVVQIDKVNQGLTKALYYIFGEIFPIAVVGVYVPMWFIEGDAVCFETAVNNMGRGRSPQFLNEMKAQIVEKGIYPMYKATVGSYKNYIPNRYNMGYFMTANTRANYGPEIWADALAWTGRHPFGFTSFSTSLKNSMSQKRDSLWNDSLFRSLFINPDSVKKVNTYRDAKRTLYHDNFTELQQIWKKEAAQVTDRFDTIPTRNKYYANYYYPTPLTNGKLLAYKQGMQQTGAFVQLENGKEKILTPTGILDDYKFAHHQNLILWSEYHQSIRWAQGGRVGLSSYNLHTKRYKRYKSHHNRFSPFTAGENWGCVEVNNQNQASIVLLDAALKNEILRINANQDELFIHPSFDNGQITTIVQTPTGLHIESIDSRTGNRTIIAEKTTYELDNPIILDSTLYFRASFNGNNSFYSQDKPKGKLSNILNAPFGVNFPARNATSDSLFFSFYTSNGYKPAKVALANLSPQVVEKKQFRLADTLKKQEDWNLQLNIDTIYKTKRYNKFTHLINIHSWGPLIADLNKQKVDLGLVVYSQNKLSTLSFTAGYALKSGFDHGQWMFNASYSGWWPIFDLSLKSEKYDYQSFDTQATNVYTHKTDTLYLYNKSSLSSADITVRLPFNISVKNYNRSIQPYFRYQIEGIHHNKTKDLYRVNYQDNIGYLYQVNAQDYQYHVASRYYQLFEYGTIFSNQTRMSTQEINPRWGQMLEIGYTHSPLETMDLGSQWWTEGRFYFPGLFKNHSLVIYSGYQKMSDKKRNYSNKILSPRGISMSGYEMTSLRSSYHLPLIYPDWQISSLLYFKSIDGAVFYDRCENKNLLSKRSYQSYGMELTTNTHFFRLTFPVNMGVRAGYETQHKRMFANILFSIGLSI